MKETQLPFNINRYVREKLIAEVEREKEELEAQKTELLREEA